MGKLAWCAFFFVALVLGEAAAVTYKHNWYKCIGNGRGSCWENGGCKTTCKKYGMRPINGGHPDVIVCARKIRGKWEVGAMVSNLFCDTANTAGDSFSDERGYVCACTTCTGAACKNLYWAKKNTCKRKKGPYPACVATSNGLDPPQRVGFVSNRKCIINAYESYANYLEWCANP